MRDKVTFEYAVIRVVPKVEREEFVNVGVIVFSKPKKFLNLKIHVDEQKLLALDPGVDLELVKRHLEAWKSICSGGPEGGSIGAMEIASRFRWLTNSRSTMIQSSRTHTGLCDDPEEVLAEAFDFFVL